MSCTETAKLLHFSSSKFLFSMVTSVNYIMVILNKEIKGCAVESLVFIT